MHTEHMSHITKRIPKIYIGKYFVAVRFKNDLCFGVGRPSPELRAEVVRSRPHRGI